MEKDITGRIKLDEDGNGLPFVSVPMKMAYSISEPMIVLMKMPDDTDNMTEFDNVWVIGRELLAECLIDGKVYAGEGDILILYAGKDTVRVSLANEDVECFDILFNSKELSRFLDMTYIICARRQETYLTIEKLIKDMQNYLIDF